MKILNKNYIRSTKGFEFWIKNPFQLIYSEGEYQVTIPGEMLTGGPELLVSVSTINYWDRPHQSIHISPSKKQEIIDNIMQALDLLKIKFIFD